VKTWNPCTVRCSHCGYEAQLCPPMALTTFADVLALLERGHEEGFPACLGRLYVQGGSIPSNSKAPA
jgi:hypothetical protein